MRRDPVTAYIALGANLGDARSAVLQALAWLDQLPETRLVQGSRLYRTAPLQADGPDFVNAVAAVETRLTAPGLLQALQALEAQAGRTRAYLNAPRTLDLDLLLYGQARIHSDRLTVPHPRMRGRAFVLRPLADVAPALVSAAELKAVSEQIVTALESESP